MKTQMQERLGKNVRRLREGSEMDQEELARRAGIHRTQICSIEAGRSSPRLETLLKLVGALASSPNELLDGMAWRPPPTEEGQWVVAPTPSEESSAEENGART